MSLIGKEPLLIQCAFFVEILMIHACRKVRIQLDTLKIVVILP